MPTTTRDSFVLLALATLGCNHETKDPNSNDCTDIPGVEDCRVGDTGDTGDDEPAEFPSGECRHNLDSDYPDDFGWRFQCEGHLFASISFDAPFGNDCESLIGDRCHEHHIFGPSNDNYESPDVMACCGEYLPAYKEEYFEYCDYDIVQQVCISMAKRLEKMVEDGTFGAYAGQGAKLQQWIATNYKTCFEELRANDTTPEFGRIISSFAVPNDPGWPDIQNFVISIDDGTSVSGVTQPADPADWLTCQSALDNNDEIFEDAAPPGGGVVHGVDLAGEVNGALVGPVLFGGQVTASVRFDPNCAAKGCSTAAFRQSMDGTRLVVQDVTLFTDRFTVANADGVSMNVDSARISLYEQASTTPRYREDGKLEGFEVQPGDAFFLFSGSAGNVHDHYLAHNASPIRISQADGLWVIEPFSIEYIDESGATWSISLSASSWR